jgi:hypothetical protein
MDKEDRETIRHMSDALDEILAILKRPENRLAKMIDFVAAGVGILGILSIADIIRNWILGG